MRTDTDGQTDMMKLMVAFRNSAKKPKNMYKVKHLRVQCYYSFSAYQLFCLVKTWQESATEIMYGRAVLSLLYSPLLQQITTHIQQRNLGPCC